MPTHAATATTAITFSGALVLILGAVTFGYLLTCWLRPFRRCRWCHGTGTRRSLVLRALRTCHPCHGTGRQLRAGRRAINALRELHDRSVR